MRADAAPLLSIFEKKMRLEVPLFQRQYVWSQDSQWEPLWDDIARKFSDYIEGRKDTPVHFLGAMVLDQKQTPTTHVDRRQVIDGQQRLTTLQIFLAAFRDFCRENGCDELAMECESFIFNKGMMADATVDRFKVWPTQLDRKQFSDVLSAGSRSEIDTRYPLTKRKYARSYDPRPRMVEAYVFFYEQLQEFFVGNPFAPFLSDGASGQPLSGDTPIAKRLEESFQALKAALYVAVIDLDRDDDAQVIFETLNARGEPLLPADLLRNYIFLRAGRAGEDQEVLYNEHWQAFDDPFWRTEVRQGRLVRPRSDLFMQHFLASRRTVDTPIRHLFVEYKFWIEKHKPFGSVREELATLARQGHDFRRLLDPTKNDVVYALAVFLDRFDVSTAYPLLLHLLDSRLTNEQWKSVSRTLESYLLRRAVCNLTTKGYNRIFLSLTKSMRGEGTSPERLEQLLLASDAESVEWPSDEAFRTAWTTHNAYSSLQNAKIVHIMRRLNETYMAPTMEEISIDTPLSIEHLLPQGWIEHWTLPNGVTGLTDAELWDADANDPRAQGTRRRNALLQTFGNLTILTQPLNSAVQNREWAVKKPAIMAASLLPINQQLHSFESWDESTIERRSEELFDRALRLWPRPAQARQGS